jgi:hypothetical protein
MLCTVRRNSSQAPVARIGNPSNSGSRDQKDSRLKPALANSLEDPISKNPSQKRADGVTQGVGPEFKPQNSKKKKEEEIPVILCYIFFQFSL